MSGFSADWLALRAPADSAARSERVVAFVARPFQGRLLDLGGGTGANIRYLASRLPSPQHWTLVDDDPLLIEHVPAAVATRRADLTAAVEDTELFRGCALVTASALLDLVSERWLAALIRRCRAVDAAVLFALSYDGRIVCTPPEPEDEDVRQLVNAHQKTDKGFGPALGPGAPARAVALLLAAGYDVTQGQSDWHLGPGAAALQRALVDGWAAAASEMASGRTASIEGWRTRRLAHVDAGRSHMTVGHVDIAGILAT
jgi:hypothetical protein